MGDGQRVEILIDNTRKILLYLGVKYKSRGIRTDEP